jgi:UV DNA damage endonuclease
VSRLGYATQNLTVRSTTNRTLRLADLSDVEKVRTLARKNIAGLLKLLRWNAGHGAGPFRIDQGLILFAFHPAFPYAWEHEHSDELRKAGALACSLWASACACTPASLSRPEAPSLGAERRLDQLRYVARVFDLLDGRGTVIVLRMGGAYEDKPTTGARFVETMRPETTLLRYLALESDERISAVPEIALTASALGVPTIAEAFHHNLNPGGLTLEEAMDLSLPTRKRQGLRPKVHLSSQDPDKQAGAHAYSVDTGDLHALQALNGRGRT